MQSVAHAVLLRSPRACIAYLHAEQWMNLYATNIRHGRVDKFRDFFRSVDAFLVDDIHCIANKERTQEEFFHTFNTLIDNRKQIVLTSDRYAKDIDELDERLKSRFTWGLSVEVEPPDFETRVAILLAKAESANIRLPVEAASFVAHHIRSNVRELEGALCTLVAAARLRGEPLTMDFVQSTLKSRFASYERT